MITRRQLAALLGAVASAQPRPLFDLSTIPNFCSHEHWGSVDSIGSIPGGYRADYERGARPRSHTGLWDLLIDPYMRGLMLGAGVDHNQISRGSGWRWWLSLQPILAPYQFSGFYQCTRRGIQSLYGVDIANLESTGLARLESLIDSRYRQPFGWYRKAMTQAHFSGLIRPVHPEFYCQQESQESAEAERHFTRTVMRIDPFLEYWTGPPERRQSMARLSGIEPVDAPSWRSFLAWWFDQAARGGAVGIKQLQAYRRSLDFPRRSDEQIRWTDAGQDENRKRQDWIVHECCGLAQDRGWAHQVHVGTHNLPHSSPLPLAGLARQYPRMKPVLIHCWPFLSESGTMARQIANVYIDTCWQPLLNPEFFRQAMTDWWNYVPAHKITCGHDATTVEMAAGSALFTREILSGILSQQMLQGRIGGPALIQAARSVLHGNAVFALRSWACPGHCACGVFILEAAVGRPEFVLTGPRIVKLPATCRASRTAHRAVHPKGRTRWRPSTSKVVANAMERSLHWPASRVGMNSAGWSPGTQHWMPISHP